MANQQHQNQPLLQPDAFAQLASQVPQGPGAMGMQGPTLQQQQAAQMMMNPNVAMVNPQLVQAGLMMPPGMSAPVVTNTPQQPIPLLWPNGGDAGGGGGNMAPGGFPIPMTQLSAPTMGADFTTASPLLQSQGLSQPVPVSEGTSVSTKSRSNAKKSAPKTKAAPKSSKGAKKGDENSSPKDDQGDKAQQSRERNREHARSTRLRKKAYIQKLKEMATGLRSMQTAEIHQRRISMQQMLDKQAIRRAVVQKFLQYHSKCEKDPMNWTLLLEENFWLKEPVTPFRSFRRSEVDGDSRIVRGIEGMICDAASLSLMLERVGCYNARWKRIKRNDFVDGDFLNKEITVRNGPGSSLSSASSTGSSETSKEQSGKTTSSDDSKRGSASVTDLQNQKKRSAGAAKSSSSEASSAKRQRVAIADGQNSAQPRPTSTFPQANSITSASQQQYPHNALSSYNLKLANNKQRTSASYYINEDDMIMIEDAMMCPFMFRTRNAVACGALADCVIPGMLRVQFSPNNKLMSMEMVFDAMGFMQQLDGANGGNITAQVIPGSLEMALVHCAHEARVITEAKAPYNVLHVNENWTALTEYSQLQVEGKSLLPLLEGRMVVSDGCAGEEEGAAPAANNVANEEALHVLEEAVKGRPGCTTSMHYGKSGRRFADFMCTYPLTNAQDEITHLLHVSMELPAGGTQIA